MLAPQAPAVSALGLTSSPASLARSGRPGAFGRSPRHHAGGSEVLSDPGSPRQDSDRDALILPDRGTSDSRLVERLRPRSRPDPVSKIPGVAPLPPAGSPVPPQKVKGLPGPAAREHSRRKSQVEPPWPPGVSFLSSPPTPRPTPTRTPRLWPPRSAPDQGLRGPEGSGEQWSWPQS